MFRFAHQRSINKADNSCGNGGPMKAGLAPQVSIVSRQPLYNKIRSRTMYTKNKQPANYLNLMMFTCNK